MSLDIFLTNNLTNKKEKFIPQDKNNVRMYVCGPTVYDDPHIGNARPLVVFDILFKILKNQYSNVTYVRNITDVDDKIIKSSKENNISILDLTKKITQNFNAVNKARLVLFTKDFLDDPLLLCEMENGNKILEEDIKVFFKSQFKLNTKIKFVKPGEIPNDGIVIEDKRTNN